MIANTPLVPPPLTVSSPAPGPTIWRFLLMSSAPLVSVIVWPSSFEENWIVAPSLALMSAWRSEPAPLSLVFVTVIVLKSVLPSSASARGTYRNRDERCLEVSPC